MNPSQVTIWDGEKRPPGPGPCLYWRGWDESEGISIPRYVDEHGDRLRKKYLSFIHQLGESLLSKKTVVQHLDVGDGFSYWWMSLLSEKNPFKSTRIYDCIRLFALEEILIEHKYTSISLVSGDLETKKSIRKLCSNLKIDCSEVNQSQPNKKFTLRFYFNKLPFPIQGFMAFSRHIYMRWELRKLKRPNWFSGEDAVFMCSYFFNLNEESCESGEFRARQWGELPQLLKKLNIKSNWIHQLVLNPGAPPRKKGLKWMSWINENPNSIDKHTYLDTFLSCPVLIKALKDWVYLVLTGWRLRSAFKIFKPKGSEVDLWPFLNDDWKNSVSGPVAVNNCLWRALFDDVLRQMPHQSLGFYLWENQGWELALLHAWRHYGHGKIIGVPHATTVFWHLNNFDDVRVYNESMALAKPSPDFLAVNGPMAEYSFMHSGTPSKKLLKVEALRYQYLDGLDSKKVRGSHKKTDTKKNPTLSYKLLILGDASLSQTTKMMNYVKTASLNSRISLEITLKPHPACRFDRKNFEDFDFTVSSMPLESMINEYEIAFVGNTSSAALDAALSGLGLIVFLEDDDFNHCPLRGFDSIFFVNSGSKLEDVLQANLFTKFPYKVESFFWLDDKMPLWRKILPH